MSHSPFGEIMLVVPADVTEIIEALRTLVTRDDEHLFRSFSDSTDL